MCLCVVSLFVVFRFEFQLLLCIRSDVVLSAFYMLCRNLLTCHMSVMVLKLAINAVLQSDYAYRGREISTTGTLVICYVRIVCSVVF